MPIVGPQLDGPVDMARLLAPSLLARPDALALATPSRHLTYRELDEAARRLAAGYLALGLAPGDRVATLMPNRAELIVHYLAAMACGLVAVPLNYRYMAPEIDHALGVSGARLLVAHEERAADLSLSRLVPGLPLGTIGYRDGDGGDFARLLSHEPGADLVPAAPDEPALIFFTSGSTGKPKGVCHSLATLGWIMASAVQSFQMGPDDVMLAGGSASHCGAHHLSAMTLAAGGTVVLPRTFDAAEILPLLRQERPTKLWMLPSSLYALVRDHGARHADFASVRFCFSGGDKVSEPLEAEFTDLAGIVINEDYGMTELGIPTVNPPERPRLGSVGRIAPGYRASVRDAAGREVAQGEGGLLHIAFPGNMIGYWDNPAQTAATVADGWLDTGDLMHADGDGYLWFEGRQKQIIIHDGSNICPQDVEAALLEHAAVAEAGVVGVANPFHGENVRAYVTLSADTPRPTMDDLIGFARARIGYKAPEEVIVLDTMPLNATGKVDRVRLKAMAQEAADTGASAMARAAARSPRAAG